MHTVVIRKELAVQCPGLAKAIYQGFCDAKDVAMEHYTKGTIFNNMNIMMPWFSNLIDKDRRVLVTTGGHTVLRPIAKRLTPSCATILNKVSRRAG
jgi:hypothetical protein